MNQEIAQNFLELALLARLAEEVEEEEENGEPRKKKRIWVKDWVSRRGLEVPLYREIREEDREKFKANFRISPEDFDVLLARYIEVILDFMPSRT